MSKKKKTPSLGIPTSSHTNKNTKLKSDRTNMVVALTIYTPMQRENPKTSSITQIDMP